MFSPTRPVEWSRQITVEERQYIRERIKTAYKRKAPTYEELLDVACSIEEELVFGSAPSRLDYFKCGVQYEKRVTEKQAQLKMGVAAILGLERTLDDQEADTPKIVKRAKTQH